MHPLHRPVLDWFDEHARVLPWRAPEATPWAVLVSEIMLQQTPVARVLPVFERWLETWPTPTALAAAAPGDAVRAWGRLGYPRRALRLHAAAARIVDHHGGEVPGSVAELRALPGVGEYTAAAVAVFGFGHRHAVLDTNVRRVLGRVLDAHEFPPAAPTRAERERAARLLPTSPARSAAWSVAVMELGALVCTAARPRCPVCPVAGLCRWRQAGHPAHAGPPRRVQTWAGTDRQCRGRLLAVLRAAEGPVPSSALEAAWAAEDQRQRCLASLLADGLLVRAGPERFALPG